MKTYDHILSRVFGRPLFLSPRKAEQIAGALNARIFGGVAMNAAWDKDDEDEQPDDGVWRPYDIRNGIALIGVNGTLVHNSATASPPSGFTPYSRVERKFSMAVKDPSVRGILLDVDSGGGEVSSSLRQLADTIFAARDAKPVWSVADDYIFSAAYYIRSAASRVLLPMQGGMGSIGVIAMHLDVSAYDKKEGLKYTTVFAGARKNDFNPHEPLNKEALAEIQDTVDAAYEDFVSVVARHRKGLSVAKIKATEAASYEGEAAVAAGLADGIATFAAALDELAEHAARPAQTISFSTPRGAAAQTKGNGKETHMSEANTPAAPQTAPQAEAPAPAAATANASASNVVSLDAARDQGYALAAEIVDLCAVAGFPEKASAFIAAKTAAAQVREDLKKAQATRTAPPTTSAHLPGAGVKPGTAPVLDAASIYATRRASIGGKR